MNTNDNRDRQEKKMNDFYENIDRDISRAREVVNELGQMVSTLKEYDGTMQQVLLELKTQCTEYKNNNKNLTQQEKEFLQELQTTYTKALQKYARFTREIPNAENIHFKSKTYVGILFQAIIFVCIEFRKQIDELEEKVEFLQNKK